MRKLGTHTCIIVISVFLLDRNRDGIAPGKGRTMKSQWVEDTLRQSVIAIISTLTVSNSVSQWASEQFSYRISFMVTLNGEKNMHNHNNCEITMAKLNWIASIDVYVKRNDTLSTELYLIKSYRLMCLHFWLCNAQGNVSAKQFGAYSVVF